MPTVTMMKYLPSIGAPEEPQCLKPRRHSCNPTGHTFKAFALESIFFILLLCLILMASRLATKIEEEKSHDDNDINTFPH